MAEANAPNLAPPRPEDAPSEVEPFDEGSVAGGDGRGLERDAPPRPENAPSEVEPFDVGPEEGAGPARGRNAGGQPPPRREPRGRSPEDDAGLRPEDAPSEVEQFDVGPEEGGQPTRNRNVGRRPSPRRENQGRARNPQRRGTRGRAQNPPRRQNHGGARNPPRRETHGGVRNPTRRGTHGGARDPATHATNHELRDARRARRDAAGQPKPKDLSTTDFMFPNSKTAKYNRAVDRVRNKVYRVPRERAGNPLRRGYYRWYVSEYVSPGRNSPEKRRVIVEGGPERLDVLFDEETSNKNIHTWIAQKILEQRGEGRPAPRPSEMREQKSDDVFSYCCSMITRSSPFISVQSRCTHTRLSLKSPSTGYPSDEETLIQCLQPRPRLRGGAASPARTNTSHNSTQDKIKGKSKRRDSSQSPVHSSDSDSGDDDKYGPVYCGPSKNKRSKGKGRQRDSSRPPGHSPNSESEDNDKYGPVYGGPSKSRSRSRLQKTKENIKVRSSPHGSHRKQTPPYSEGSLILPVDETTDGDLSSQIGKNDDRPCVPGDPYRLRRIKGHRKAHHDEEKANLSDPDNIVIHIRRDKEGKHRTRIRVEGFEDRFHTRERDNEMPSEEIADHIVAAVEHSWRPLGRPPSPSPSCRCLIL